MQRLLPLTAFFSLLLGTCRGDCVDNATLDGSADGYQRPAAKWSAEANREWWFFTLYDPALDIGLALSYGAGANTKPVQTPGMVGMVYHNASKGGDSAATFVDLFADEKDFAADTKQAAVRIGPSKITPKSETEYEVVGTSKDGSVKWFLTYKRQTYPDRQIQNVLPFIANLDWISYMPSAQVSGVVQLSGSNYTLSAGARGYHDHNYGFWPTKLFNWLWGQFSADGSATANTGKAVASADALSDGPFSVVFGSYGVPLTHDKISVGYVFMRIGTERVKMGTLCGNGFSLTPLAMKTWSDGRKLSVHNRIETGNENWKLAWEWRALTSFPNPGGDGLGLEVFEQLSKHNATVSRKGQDGKWTVVRTVEGFGFTEWSDTTFAG